METPIPKLANVRHETTHEIEKRTGIPAPYLNAAANAGRLKATPDEKGVRDIWKISRPDLEFFLLSEASGPHRLKPVDTAVNDLTLDRRYNFRQKTSQPVVKEYTAQLEQNVTFPPIVVCKLNTEHFIIDGGHQWTGAINLKRTTILAYIIGDLNEQEIVLLAAMMNRIHGQRRTKEDQQAVIAALFNQPEFVDLSTRVLAELSGGSHMTIHRFRKKTAAAKNDKEIEQTKEGQTTREIALVAIESNLKLLEISAPEEVRQIRELISKISLAGARKFPSARKEDSSNA